ncbi:MAG TPA: glycoside hydrolase family 3 C-terminal domain-containing protein, partial [Marinilabiliaceae bacterium]|nr:glycoside hydrolase family 3 C-terminal domain-containing protein [Marinilabiliaceae bacterium]
YKEGVYGALDHGYLSENDIDDVLKGVYRVMIKLGQLDPASSNPYALIGKEEEIMPWDSEKHQEVALLAAQKSIVLLKNENQLPLDKEKIKKVAVIGWLADTVLLDWYSGLPPYRITPLQGIIDKVGAENVIYATDNSYNAAAKAAQLADVAIVVLGNNPITVDKWADSPDPAQGKEGIDRKSLHLYDESLVQWVVEANPNTILVVQSSFPYAINWSQEHVPAILHMAHNGQETGTALADVLFGDYNPGGRLTQTWPKSVNQLPSMMEYDIRKGHTYLYFKEEPLYSFGFGLSYSKFKYSSAKAKVVDGHILVSLEVENKGILEGDEVIQIYASFPDSKVERPTKSLKGFARTTFKAGEKKRVEIPIKLVDLAYWDVESQSFVVEPGKVNLSIGASSADIRLMTNVVVQ